MNKSVVVVAVSVDARHVILFSPDGSSVTLVQGDPRITNIMAAVKEPLSEVPPRPVEVSLEMPRPIMENPEFGEAEQASGGVIRFFKVAKKSIADWFKDEPEPAPAVADPAPSAYVSPQTLGVVPGSEVEPAEEVTLEPGNYDVLLTDYLDGNKVAVIKAIRVTTGAGFRESADLVNASKPVMIATSVTAAKAQDIREQVLLAGGQVQLVKTPTGDKPVIEPAAPLAPVAPAEKTIEEKLAEANARLDILEAEGIKPSDPKFKEGLKEDETVVAVTNGGRTIIPEAQHLGNQLKAATTLKDFTGFQKFLERLGTVVNKRRFSVEDLMKFMKHGDLPIADDGSIVIYKRLTKSGKDKQGRDIYVDVYSRCVTQRVGSRVFMDESLVDPDRRQDCSNGLHVAALSYLRSFYGEITIIGKVAPEDVIAVPEYSNNKMRVAGYDILAVLDKGQTATVNNGGKLSNVKGGAELLNAVLRGKHIKIDQTVQIGGAQGTKLTITDLEDVDSTVAPLQPEDIRNTNLDIPDAEGAIPPEPSKPVLPADLKPVKDAPANKVENLTPVEPKVENVKKETKAQTAQRLYDEFKGAATSTTAGTKAAELLAFKKSSKKSWTALGLSDDIGELVTEKATSVAPKVAVKTVSGFDDLKAKAPKAGSPKARLAEVLKGGIINPQIAGQALAIKKAAKKSWAVLGVSDEVVEVIESLTK
ncbi:ribosomal L7/L12 C-terminal domain protein [Pectobacterium phage A38]|uniref:Ribosomal L7/L12 C-terminal domain protein n=2 Tax=Cbunavirus A41 TaxID=2845779 RepID=A0A7I6I6I1_9CAUD|nr:RIIB lysis inhibitor [Pectobacterium phage phiA41]APD19135.1 ribosomal L7/L12 C-terminal domain protein [Pectobacterium phage A38]ARB10982.1 ribosomal L7/L12 C-terminal domain protein [Pectobacterium phage phiA41]